MKRELEIRLQDKALRTEWQEILRGLDSLDEVETKFQGQSFISVTTSHPAGSRQDAHALNLAAVAAQAVVLHGPLGGDVHTDHLVSPEAEHRVCREMG